MTSPDGVDEQVTAIIQRYQLHGTTAYPSEYVNLAPLEDMFPILLRPLHEWGVQGFVIPPIGVVSTSNPAPVTLDIRLTAHVARLAYAHEIGHGLHGHQGAFVLAEMDQWFVRRAEREAWAVAARLLVPIQTVIDYETTEAIATACDVPEWLVDLAAGT